MNNENQMLIQNLTLSITTLKASLPITSGKAHQECQKQIRQMERQIRTLKGGKIIKLKNNRLL